jgi:hypothetical protein
MLLSAARNGLVVVLSVAFFVTIPVVHAQDCGDFDNNGVVSASDTLRHLNFVVGADVELNCPAGLNCWDLDGDTLCSAAEDMNGDNVCTALDCQGAPGEPGPPGADGEPGEPADPAVTDALEARIGELEAIIATLAAKTVCMTATSTDTFFDGCNVHVRSGAGATDAEPNALGNLIVGYDEPKPPLETTCGGFASGDPCLDDGDCTGELCLPAAQGGGCDTGPVGAVCFADEECDDDGTCVFARGETAKTGSHNLIIGTQHEYTSYAGIVVGERNRIVAPYAAVTGGRRHNVVGEHGAVSGGDGNNASGGQTSVGGGRGNWARATRSSILGGGFNRTDGTSATVSGGDSNNAAENGSVVSGGVLNTAAERFSSVGGGRLRTTVDEFDWIAGSLIEDE